MCNLSAAMTSALTLALSAKLSKPDSFLVAPPPPTVLPSVPTNSSVTARILFPSSNSSPSSTATGVLFLTRSKSNLELWRMRSVRRVRDSPDWGPKTSAYYGSSRAMLKPTRPLPGSTHSSLKRDVLPPLRSCGGHYRRNYAAADLIYLAFHFLYRPGEYTVNTNPESSPHLLEDVQLLVGNRSLDVRVCSDPDLDSTTFVSLTFPNQKNSVRGEVVGLGRSGSPDCWPLSGPSAE
jgi:hypothetical protein